MDRRGWHLGSEDRLCDAVQAREDEGEFRVDVPVEREVAVVELSEGVVNCLLKRFTPFPQGALKGAKRLKFSMMSVAMKEHMPLGYAAVGAVWNPPFAFRPITFSL